MRASSVVMLGLLMALPLSAVAEDLLISVNGCRVTVDGKVVEEHAPQRLKLKLERGRHQVKVEHAGFEAWSGEVEATALSIGNVINAATARTGRNASRRIMVMLSLMHRPS